MAYFVRYAVIPNVKFAPFFLNNLLELEALMLLPSLSVSKKNKPGKRSTSQVEYGHNIRQQFWSTN